MNIKLTTIIFLSLFLSSCAVYVVLDEIEDKRHNPSTRVHKTNPVAKSDSSIVFNIYSDGSVKKVVPESKMDLYEGCGVYVLPVLPIRPTLPRLTEEESRDVSYMANVLLNYIKSLTEYDESVRFILTESYDNYFGRCE